LPKEPLVRLCAHDVATAAAERRMAMLDQSAGGAGFVQHAFTATTRHLLSVTTTWADLESGISGVSPGGAASYSLDADFFIPTTGTRRKISIVNKQINITGNGATLDGGSINRFFNLSAGAVLRLFGPMTITNGKAATYGGAIYVDSATLELRDITFQDNICTCYSWHCTFSAGGGAVFVGGSTSRLVIYTSTFESNMAKFTVGGAIRVSGATSGSAGHVAAIYTSTFRNNTGLRGGAIYTYGCSLNIRNSVFEENEAHNFGDSSGTYPQGGALRVDTGNVEIVSSTFTSNKAHTHVPQGGAIFLVVAEAKIDSSVFERNTAQTGGAIAQFGSTLRMSNCAAERNKASTKGHALYTTSTKAYNHIDLRNISFREPDDGMGGGYLIYLEAGATKHRNLLDASQLRNYILREQNCQI
jgi:predicted outer membrane repeat protein